LIHGFISSTPEDGGLGIIPGRKEWGLVESVMALHDHDFNDDWIHLWTRHRIATVELEKIRDQFGDSVALYFFFLTAYTGFDISRGTWRYLLSLRETLLCFIFHFTPVVVNCVRRMVETARAYPVNQMVHSWFVAR
jgi:hypothetical protein